MSDVNNFTEKAILAAGCFWGVEELLRTYPGVIDTEVGYCGGAAEDALYTKVKTGTTSHAEAVLVTFDPKLLSFEKLIHAFYRLHDPTTLDRQGNDVGSQYRSAIFYFSEKQKQTAEVVTREVEESKIFQKPIVTRIVPAGKFYSAENYHQDYLQKNPGGYMCHFWRS